MGQLSRTGGCAAAVEAGLGVTTMKRIAAACFVGSVIEFYDFLIYGTAAALVFPTVFFPHLSPATATTASMGTFAAAFLSRPLFVEENARPLMPKAPLAELLRLQRREVALAVGSIIGVSSFSSGSWAIGVMLASYALTSLVCTYLLPETNGKPLRSARGADDLSAAS